MQDLVSIIIPAYNCEDYIENSIESCLNQNYDNIEIIVINDGSTDKTLIKIIDLSNKYKNIKYLNIKHSGKVKAINEGIKICKGSYIAIHAADDVCFEYRITEQVKKIKENEKNILCYGDFVITDKNLNILYDKYHCFDKEITIEKLLYSNLISGGTILLDGKIKDYIFPIPENLLFEDWWIAFRACMLGNIVYLKKPVIKYRQHTNNDNGFFSTKSKKQKLVHFRKDFQRHFSYYEEFINYIKKDNNIKNKEFYFNIINYNILLRKLSLESIFIKRIMIFYKNKNVFKDLTIKKIIKLLIIVILGQRYYYFKS